MGLTIIIIMQDKQFKVDLENNAAYMGVKSKTLTPKPGSLLVTSRGAGQGATVMISFQTSGGTASFTMDKSEWDVLASEAGWAGTPEVESLVATAKGDVITPEPKPLASGSASWRGKTKKK